MNILVPVLGCLTPPLIAPSIPFLDPALPTAAGSGPGLGQSILLMS